MAIDSNTKLGPYEIISAVGSGGMGQVYKARDTRLDRTVAIKVLLDLSSTPERSQRLQREAHAIAALNHPHICTLFDVGRHEDIEYLVMEYLDGETLAARLERGALPIPEAIRYGMQLAEALDKAHRQGIIHRDLKPANIMITASGIKILDFGLAKFRETPQTAPTALSAFATRDASLTQEGTVLGTVQYMSPEQIEGKDADARTDVFALGLVLYEMLSGRKAFEGKSQVSLMAAILERDPPPLSSIRPLPSSLDRIVQTCFAKDPDDRFQTAREVLRELKWAENEKPSPATLEPPVSTLKNPRTAWVVAGLALLGFAAALVPAITYLREPAPDPTVSRFAIEPPFMPNLNYVAISPNGRGLAFSANGPNNVPVLWVRSMDSMAAQVLPGTEGAGGPSWSPDSQSILFTAGGKLKRIDVGGGAPQTLCDASNPNGATWSAEGVIVFSSDNTLYRIADSGGQPSKLFDHDAAKQETRHLLPSFLPDGKRFLFSAWSPEAENRAIYIGSIESADRVRILDTPIPTMAIFAAPGYLLYQRAGALMAQPFDLERAVVTGDAYPIAEAVSNNITSGLSSFSAAANSTLVYTDGTTIQQQLVWRDRAGKLLSTVGNPDSYAQVRLSPDEKRAAYPRRNPGGDSDLWLVDVSSGVASRFTNAPGNETDPVWSSDSRQVAFISNRSGNQNLYSKSVGANQDELLFESSETKYLEDWSRDGQILLFRVGTVSPSSEYAFSPTDRKATKVFENTFDKDEMHLSPDRRWVAFNSDESGRIEVYVASFPTFTDKRQVSNTGGGVPFWRADGRELFYMAQDGKLMSMDVSAGATFESSAPKALFQTRVLLNNLGVDQYNVSANGQKFLILEPVGDVRPNPITVVLNWTAALPINK